MHDGTVGDLVRRFGDERTLVVDLDERAPPVDVLSVEEPDVEEAVRRLYGTTPGS